MRLLEQVAAQAAGGAGVPEEVEAAAAAHEPAAGQGVFQGDAAAAAADEAATGAGVFQEAEAAAAAEASAAAEGSPAGAEEGGIATPPGAWQDSEGNQALEVAAEPVPDILAPAPRAAKVFALFRKAGFSATNISEVVCFPCGSTRVRLRDAAMRAATRIPGVSW